MLSFTCIDCAIDKESHLICEACFKRTDHKNHKVQLSNDYVGTCDCGDLSVIKKEGCCALHLQQSLTEQQLTQEIEARWSKDYISNFESVLVTLLTQLIVQIEPQPLMGDKTLVKERGIKLEPFSSLAFHLISNILTLVHETNFNFCFMLRNILLSKIASLRPACARQMMHSCQALQPQPPQKPKEGDGYLCSCTFLEQLFRISPRLDEISQQQLEKLLCILYKNDAAFQRSLIAAYARCFNFMVYSTELQDYTGSTYLFNLYSQFLSEEASQVWLVECAPHAHLLYEKTKELIRQYFAKVNICRYAYNTYMQLKNIYQFWFKKEICYARLNYEKIIDVLVDCTFFTQTLRSPALEDEIEKCRLHIECSQLMLIKQLIGKIYLKPQEERLELLVYMMSRMIEQMQGINLEEEVAEKIQWPIHYTGLRAFSIVVNLITIEKDQDFVEQILLKKLQSKENIERLCAQVIRCSLKSLRFSKLTDEKVGSFLDLISDPQKSMKIEIINSFYKKSFYGQYDLDVAILQNMFSLIKEKNSAISIMNVISSVYGDIDIKKIYFSTQDALYIKNLASVLEFIVVLAIDSTTFLNSIACSAIFRQKSDARRPPWLMKHLSNLLVNAFHLSKVHDMKTLKGALFDKILNYDIKVDQFVEDITEKCVGTTNLRLRDKHAQQFEPYIFHKYSRLTSDIYEKIKLLTSKNDALDWLLGTQASYEKENFQRRVINNLFSDDLPKYLMLVSDLRPALARYCTHLLASTRACSLVHTLAR